MPNVIHESELILNPDGSIYHLNLFPEDVADTIITVGDPGRVSEVSQYFDTIELKKQKREFVTHTGYLNKHRLTVISTGISTDNIDVVFNELDALVNIDLQQRRIKPSLKKLDIIRIGTAGSLHAAIPLDTFVVSDYAIGLEGLANFYQYQATPNEQALHAQFLPHFPEMDVAAISYVASGSSQLTSLFKPTCWPGITLTCSGFYGPQGRILRAQPKLKDFINRLQRITWQNYRLTNLEMETAGIYALSKILGHNCCSLSAIIANRHMQTFSSYPQKVVDQLIQFTLEKVAYRQTAAYEIPNELNNNTKLNHNDCLYRFPN